MKDCEALGNNKDAVVKNEWNRIVFVLCYELVGKQHKF
jgi:hypothetical protein